MYFTPKEDFFLTTQREHGPRNIIFDLLTEQNKLQGTWLSEEYFLLGYESCI